MTHDTMTTDTPLSVSDGQRACPGVFVGGVLEPGYVVVSKPAETQVPTMRERGRRLIEWASVDMLLRVGIRL